MAEGGFEVTNNSKKNNQLPKAERNQRPQTARGGGRGRGGRPRGGDGEKPFRPNTGRQVTTNEDGEQVNTKRGGDRKQYRGKDGDRKSGMGRGTFKPGYNREKPSAKEEVKATEVPEEEKKPEEPKQEMVEEVLGQSLDDFFKNRTTTKIAQGREAEGVKGQKVQAFEATKEKQSTTLKKAQDTIATTTAETNKLFGFRGGDDAEFAGRGRGGQGRGGAPKAGGRKNVK